MPALRGYHALISAWIASNLQRLSVRDSVKSATLIAIGKIGGGTRMRNEDDRGVARTNHVKQLLEASRPECLELLQSSQKKSASRRNS